MKALEVHPFMGGIPLIAFDYLDQYCRFNTLYKVNVVLEATHPSINLEKYKEEVEDRFEDVRCPIRTNIMTDPVITRCGYTFEKLYVSINLQKNDVCPLCRTPIKIEEIKRNNEAKRLRNFLIRK